MSHKYPPMNRQYLRAEKCKSRIDPANRFIGMIASKCRKFFEYVHESNRREVAKFCRDRRGRIWFWNEWRLKWIYVDRPAAWKGFHHGGTLHAVVVAIVAWIKTGEPQIHPSYFDPKHWGYSPDEMYQIIEFGQTIGLVKTPVTHPEFTKAE